MRKIFMLLTTCIALNTAHAQVETIQKVVDVPNTPKAELYKRAVMFITKNFISANDVIQLKDEAEGKVVGKGSIRYDAPAFSPGTNYTGYFRATISIDCKDNKYRYTLDQFEHVSEFKGYSEGSLTKKGVKKKIAERAAKEYAELAAELEEGMQQAYKKDDW